MRVEGSDKVGLAHGAREGVAMPQQNGPQARDRDAGGAEGVAQVGILVHGGRCGPGPGPVQHRWWWCGGKRR